MLTKDIKNSKIELIYAYFESIDDEKRMNKYKNFAVNLTNKFTVTYDFKQNRIKIERKNKELVNNFWSISNPEASVMDMTLILGENGIGKTTLLRAIAACATENIESDLRNYIFVYYIEQHDIFFIKTTCRELVDLRNSDTASESYGFKSIIYEGTRKQGNVFGFYGLAEISPNGKVLPVGRIKHADTLTQKTESWREILPMNCFYLPVISDKNSARFIERKKLLQSVNDINNLDILKFLLADYQNDGAHFVSEYPKLVMRGTSARQSKNGEKFLNYSLQLFKAIGMGNEKTVSNHKTKFFINYNPYYIQNRSCKKIFFSCILLRFLIKLLIDCAETHNTDNSYEEIKQFLESLFSKGRNRLDIDEVYYAICMTLENFLNRYYVEYIENFKKVLAHIKTISDDLFKKDNVSIGLGYAYCSLTIESIAQNGQEAFIQLMEEIYNFEQKLQAHEDTFSLLSLEFEEMSTGEYSLLRDIFCRIAALKDNSKRGMNTKSILLIMDEPDIGLHLRWTQKFIYTLIKILEGLYPENKFQIILTSHMPFMVTDFPRNNVICLCNSQWRKKHREITLEWSDNYGFEINGIRGFHPKFGLMCNYYDILRDAFFIDIPIGEFAQFKYGKLNDEINKIEGNLSKQKLEDFQNRIDMIDEHLLRKMLQEKLDRHRTKDEQVNALKEQIERLQIQLQKLESE